MLEGVLLHCGLCVPRRLSCRRAYVVWIERRLVCAQQPIHRHSRNDCTCVPSLFLGKKKNFIISSSSLPCARHFLIFPSSDVLLVSGKSLCYTSRNLSRGCSSILLLWYPCEWLWVHDLFPWPGKSTDSSVRACISCNLSCPQRSLFFCSIWTIICNLMRYKACRGFIWNICFHVQRRSTQAKHSIDYIIPSVKISWLTLLALKKCFHEFVTYTNTHNTHIHTRALTHSCTNTGTRLRLGMKKTSERNKLSPRLQQAACKLFAWQLVYGHVFMHVYPWDKFHVRRQRRAFIQSI
jgi:hypothetical protein